MSSTIGTRITRAWRAWRQPPWPLRPFGEMPLRYRLYLPAVTMALAAVAIALWALGLVPVAPIGVGYLALVLVVAVCSNIFVFRGTEVTDVETTAFVAMTLLFAGHTVEAVLSAGVAYLIRAMHKPLVRHLVAANVVNGFTNLTIASVVVGVAVGPADVGSGRWIAACLAGFATFEVLQFLVVDVTAVAGGYFALRRGFLTWTHNAVEGACASLPVAVMVAVMIDMPGAWRLAFMLVPTVVKYREWASRDRLIEASHEASRDALTGVLNRRSFVRALEERFASDEPAAAGDLRDWLIFCDLDDFKQLNDTYGHEAGDAALVRASGEIEASTRRGDLCARFGGEEFVVLVRELDREHAGAIAERIRANIERQLQATGTTASIGVHAIDPSSETADEAVYQADIAMYVSKTSGKNRVTFSDEPPPEIDRRARGHRSDEAA